MRAFFLALTISLALAGTFFWWTVHRPEFQSAFEGLDSIFWITFGLSVYGFTAQLFLPLFVVFWLIGFGIRRMRRL